MAKEVIAGFPDTDTARFALDTVKNALPFALAEVRSNPEGGGTAHSVFGVPFVPINVASVNFPTIVPQRPNDPQCSVHLVGEPDCCKKAAKMLKQMGARPVSISPL